MLTAPLLLNSITDADDSASGRVAVSGSHGGLFVAAVASRAGLRVVILNDAGRGLHDAGVAGVRELADVGMAACAVDCNSAEIGSAADMLENGRLSFVNRIAAGLGLRVGQPVTEAVTTLEPAPIPTGRLPEFPEARWIETIGRTRVLCVDSASLITPQDAGSAIVTGSHGGLIGGNPARACKARARLVSFSDAGIGKNRVGLSRLPALDRLGVGAVTLDCMSCAIGSAGSALKTGRISAYNAAAKTLGAQTGMLLKDMLIALADHR